MSTLADMPRGLRRHCEFRYFHGSAMGGQNLKQFHNALKNELAAIR